MKKNLFWERRKMLQTAITLSALGSVANSTTHAQEFSGENAQRISRGELLIAGGVYNLVSGCVESVELEINS